MRAHSKERAITDRNTPLPGVHPARLIRSNGSNEPVGRRVGSKWTGWRWEGGCTCGSGLPGRELHDKAGIYAGITCASCKKEETFAPGIMPGDDAPYDVIEQIEED